MRETKTLILSSLDNSNKKAVLNIDLDTEGYSGSLRLYNFKQQPQGILTLGFLMDDEVYKAALSEKSTGLYSFNFKTSKHIDKFSCALINILGGEPKPLLIGTSEGKVPNDLSSSLAKNFHLLDEQNLHTNNVSSCLDSCDIDYDDEEKQAVNRAINAELGSSDKCARCNYRQAFYSHCECSHESPRMASHSEVNRKFQKNQPAKSFYPLDQSSEGTFYSEIKEQLATLFEKYPEETFLNEIIPNSKWVRVDYEDDGQYFIIGLIYENNKVQYVCYGSPGEYSVEPPREFKGMSQWLPLDPEKPEELGYWIIYQDADSGENVEIKIS